MTADHDLLNPLNLTSRVFFFHFSAPMIDGSFEPQGLHVSKSCSKQNSGFKIAAGIAAGCRRFRHPCRRFFTQEIEKNDIPSLDRQNQRPWNIIVNVSYQKVMQP